MLADSAATYNKLLSFSVLVFEQSEWPGTLATGFLTMQPFLHRTHTGITKGCCAVSVGRTSFWKTS